MNKMDSGDFEILLAMVYEGLDYSVTATPATDDQGADLIVQKGDKKSVVQAKRSAAPVRKRAIQEVVAAKRFYQATGAVVVTKNSSTQSAVKLAEANQVELLDKNGLTGLLSRARRWG